MSLKKTPSEYFVFEQPMPDASPSTQTVAFATGQMDPDVLVDRLRAHHLDHSPPARIVLLGSATRSDALVDVGSSDLISESLPGMTRYVDPPPIHVLGFDASGGLRVLQRPGPDLTSATAREALVRTGLMTIFSERDGLLEAGPGFHYVNPSDRHTTAFIRAGSVLLHSAEVAFMTFGLLRWWPPGTRRIFTDTASINAVAYSLVETVRAFNPDMPSPSIDSFSSYGGLHHFDFDEREALCLISASTSGGLEREILKKRLLPAERIVTLYYCGNPLAGSQILCDITRRTEDDVDGHAPILSFDSEAECDLCRRGSAPIVISGDAFLPEGNEVQDLTITQEHEPPWLANALNLLIGHDAIRCHGDHRMSPDHVREIYLDLSGIVRPESQSALADAVEVRLRSAVPAALAKIVHPDDPSSIALAELIADRYCSRVGGAQAQELLLTESEALAESELGVDDGTVLVVAGVVATGRSLLSITPLLRNASAGHVSYAIAVGRSRSSAEWRRLRDNLTFGRQPGEYPFMCACLCYLPARAEPGASSWSEELARLTALRDRLEIAGELSDAVRNQLDRRRATIEHAEGPALGMTQDLFLPAIQGGELDLEGGSRLALRHNFIFWRGVDHALHPHPIARATQAEVYFTIAAVLHELRQPHPGSPTLAQHEHKRSVLSPTNFARFNDGVIQAALLRAALRTELDYSHSEQLSAEMRDHILGFAARRDRVDGEAFPEFLLALAHERINLTARDSRAVAEALSTMYLPPLLDALAGEFVARLAAA